MNFKNNIYEIDGLREGPILISENASYQDWIKKVRPAIMDRIRLYSDNEIKFNLLALIPDKKIKFNEQKEENLRRKAYIQRLLGKDIENHFSDKEVTF